MVEESNIESRYKLLSDGLISLTNNSSMPDELRDFAYFLIDVRLGSFCILNSGGHFAERVTIPDNLRNVWNNEVYVKANDYVAEAVGRPILNMIQTAIVSEVDETKIAYKTDPNAPKYTRTSWAKYLRRVGPIWAYWNDSYLDPFQDLIRQEFDTEGWEFEIVEGDKLVDTYCDSYTWGHSCMSGSPALELYRDNPDVVSLLRIRKRGYAKGRALLWETDQGTKFLDRIYPSDGGAHIRAAMEYAKAQGWWYKVTHSVGGDWEGPNVMTVTLEDNGHYPYMDTLMYAKPPSGGKLVLSTHQETGSYSLTLTDDGWPFGDSDEAEDEVDYIAYTIRGDGLTEGDIDSGLVFQDPDTYEYDWNFQTINTYPEDIICVYDGYDSNPYVHPIVEGGYVYDGPRATEPIPESLTPLDFGSLRHLAPTSHLGGYTENPLRVENLHTREQLVIPRLVSTYARRVYSLLVGRCGYDTMHYVQTGELVQDRSDAVTNVTINGENVTVNPSF